MGLVETGGGFVFLTARGGFLCQTVEAGSEKAVQNPKNGKWERRWPAIEGNITDIQKRGNEWDNPKTGQKETILSWEVTIIDEAWNKFKVQFAYSSGYSKGFLNRLPYVNLNEPLRLMVGESDHETDPTKKNAWCAIRQGGIKLTPFYTKDEPRNLPPLVVTEVDGKKKYDDTAQMSFYEEMVGGFRPYFKHPDGTPTHPELAEKLKSGEEIDGVPATIAGTDDLPF